LLSVIDLFNEDNVSQEHPEEFTGEDDEDDEEEEEEEGEKEENDTMDVEMEVTDDEAEDEDAFKPPQVNICYREKKNHILQFLYGLLELTLEI